MITIKIMSELTFDEATNLWNAGFEGYIFDMTRTVDDFTLRFGQEDLLPSLSIAAYVDNEPAGFILSGVRTVKGKKISWNGGTGVASKFRHQGIGKKMMDACLKLYEENDIDLATLEAEKSNEKAIALYQQYGYEITDTLSFLQLKKDLPEHFLIRKETQTYEIKYALAQDAKKIRFYNNRIPWQTHWMSLRKDGELLLVQEKGKDIGYFLYKRIYNNEGILVNNILYGAGIAPGRGDETGIVKCALSELWKSSEEPFTKTTFNFPAANQTILKVLKEIGFTPFAEQVFMMKQLK